MAAMPQAFVTKVELQKAKELEAEKAKKDENLQERMQRLFNLVYFTILIAGIVLTPIGFAEHVIWAQWIGMLSLSAWVLVNMVGYVMKECDSSEE